MISSQRVVLKSELSDLESELRALKETMVPLDTAPEAQGVETVILEGGISVKSDMAAGCKGRRPAM